MPGERVDLVENRVPLLLFAQHDVPSHDEASDHAARGSLRLGVLAGVPVRAGEPGPSIRGPKCKAL